MAFPGGHPPYRLCNAFLISKSYLLTALLIFALLLFAIPAFAQTGTEQEPAQETLEAEVISASTPAPCFEGIEDPAVLPELQGETQQCQRIELLITAGSIKDQRVVIEDGQLPVANKATIVYKAGDRVRVDYLYGGGQAPSFYITDFIRTGQLYIMALVFVGLAVAFGGIRGMTSLLGLAISFLVLLFFMLPRILAGDDPVLIAIVSGIVIMVVTLYLSHGPNLKTTAALAGTTISLVITGLLAFLAVDFARLSGFGSDEATFVGLTQGSTVDLRGLLLAGILIGALGVLDDVTIGQSSAVFELHNVDPTMPWQRLFTHAINIGKDHIAATINTLVLAYAGASLPLLVLFAAGTGSIDSVINQEVVAEEIVRTLVGSIGLIASVPLTTLIASLIATRTPANPAHIGHSHRH